MRHNTLNSTLFRQEMYGVHASLGSFRSEHSIQRIRGQMLLQTMEGNLTKMTTILTLPSPAGQGPGGSIKQCLVIANNLQ